MKSSRRKTFPESGLNWFACCLAILCLSSSAWALAKPDLKASFNKDELMAGDKEVEIYADSLQYLRKTNTYHARGSVDIKRENYRLRADKAELNDLTGEMLATGNVILDESDNRVTAERVEYNLNTGTGTFYQAQVFLSPSYFITGAVIKKLSETVYELNDGTYTTCRQLTPDWRFKVGHARVLVDKKACLTNNLFYLKWLPVFYVPYAEVPLKRTSGFLMPQAGTTDFFGRYTRNTFFWNIADWVDTTLRYDFSEKKGNGYGMEARYALSDKSKFNGTGYHIEEKDTREKRWEGHINMEQELPLGFLAIFRLDNYSDRDYNKDYLFSNNVLTGNYSRWQQEQISYFSLTKNWDNFRFNTVVENRKNLANYPFASDDDDIDATVVNVTTNNYSIWRYPQITFTALPQKILDTPLNFQGTASYLKYEKITSNETVRKDDNSPVSLTVDKTRNERYHFQPELFMPLQPVPWFSITPRIGADYTEWEKNFRGIKKISEINGVRQDSSPLKSDKMYRKYVFYSVKTYGPEIYRNYNAHALFGVDFIKHSLFPTVTYTKVPLMQKNLRNKVINFDPIDSSAEQESINYQLTQNL
ncbi:MAG: LPS-assembly protein LptD, partial [bacterium]